MLIPTKRKPLNQKNLQNLKEIQRYLNESALNKLLINWYNNGYDINAALIMSYTFGRNLYQTLEHLLVSGEEFSLDAWDSDLSYWPIENCKLCLPREKIKTEEGKKAYEAAYIRTMAMHYDE